MVSAWILVSSGSMDLEQSTNWFHSRLLLSGRGLASQLKERNDMLGEHADRYLYYCLAASTHEYGRTHSTYHTYLP